MGIIKHFFYKHKEKFTITNLYGDWINTFSGGDVYRSTQECKQCGKRFKVGSLDPNCNIINFRFKKNKKHDVSHAS